MDIINFENGVVGQRELKEKVFYAKNNSELLHTCVVAHLAKLRRGTHATRTRSMVRGSGKKPWKQKGTGNARAGSVKSPLWRGGGVTFGPQPRSYFLKVNKKIMKAGMVCALSQKVRNGKVIVMDKIEIESPKTREFVAILKKIEVLRKALVVVAGDNRNLMLSARNIPGVRVQRVESLNIYDVMKHDNLIFTTASLDKVEERFVV